MDNRNGVRRRIKGATIRGNTINNSGAAGIFLYKASLFTVADNVVYRSWADGIHVTAGSADGRIVKNAVSQNGDDMVAIVSYAGDRKAVGMATRYNVMSSDEMDDNIYIAQNHLTDTYWGRGISVVGGTDVTIENNEISRTPTCAGIYLLRESSYLSFGDRNILVQQNSISQVQTLPPTYKPPNLDLVLTHHGAIEISSQMDSQEFADPNVRSQLSVAGIAILNNTIQNARFAAMRFGAVSRSDNTTGSLVVSGNTLNEVGVDSIAAIYPGLDRTSLSCSQNTLNGQVWASQCDKGTAPGTSAVNVTGSFLECKADGTLTRGHAPNPPGSFRIHQ